MSEERRAPVIKRILVAVDASPHSVAALEAAVALALRFQAELTGLYVEDINLLRLAELPFAQEVGQFSAVIRRLEVHDMERQLRAQTVRVRRIFEGTTARARVQWSFHVTRGSVPHEVVTAASDVDMLVLGRVGWSLLRRGRLGTTARAILARAPTMALLLPRGACVRGPMTVIYDGSGLAHRALSTAVALLGDEERTLRVLLIANGQERIQPLKQEVDDWLQDAAVQVHYRALTESTVPRLVKTIGNEECGTLILPVKSSVLEDTALQALLDEVELPVFLIR